MLISLDLKEHSKTFPGEGLRMPIKDAQGESDQNYIVIDRGEGWSKFFTFFAGFINE